MLRRISGARLAAAKDGGEIVGYAYGAHCERAAYRWTADVAVYLAEDSRGRGLGTQLYKELFATRARRGWDARAASRSRTRPATSMQSGL